LQSMLYCKQILHVMEHHNFKPGQLVVLRSGGPAMTVESVGADETGDAFVVCKWYNTMQELQTGNLYIESLMPYTGDNQPPLDSLSGFH
jgi:uncharacterized protein YodC (DUF2158 family)